MDKASVVEVVEEIAGRLNLPLTADDGRKAFGAHAYRVSGARHFAYRGLELRIIALLARWQSDIMLHYVQEAPLTTLTGLYLGKTDAAQGLTPGSAASGSEECVRGVVMDKGSPTSCEKNIVGIFSSRWCKYSAQKWRLMPRRQRQRG